MEECKKVYYNLTHPQKRIWYIDKINTNSPLHNIGGCLRIYDNICIDKMRETINLIIKSNEGLRLRFIEKNGQPFQYVHKFQKENIEFIDFSNYEFPIEEHKKWSDNVFKKKFRLENNKLYYFVIYKISDKKYGVLLNIHHIIADGWAISLIEKQICDIYSKVINNEYKSLDKHNSYLDFIDEENEYLKSGRFLKNKEFWKNKCKDIPDEFLYKTSISLEGRRKSFDIDSNLSNKIKEFIKNKRCSLNTFFIVVLLIYVNKITNEKDLVIGTPVFNRSSKNQKSMIGMFTSTVPVRVYLDTELSVENLIKVINRELKLCFLNQKYPYDLLIKDLQIGKEGYDSFFKMCVNYYNSKYEHDIGGMDATVEEYYSGNQSYSLQLTVKEWNDDNITLNFDYKVKEYSDLQIEVMYKSMINIIREILKNVQIIVDKVKLINNEERDFKINKINSTNKEYPSKTIYKLFEEQVIKTPNKIALEFNEETLTYKQLNEKSNQLANYLRQNHIINESIIGIMETHSLELVISILAVLKAGGAYLPIDPSYPIERINYMLEDSKSNMLLTNFECTSDIKVKGNIVNIKNIDLNLYSKENLTTINNLYDLVYVIYTSGSTGRPKGVMIEHRGLTNYIWWAKKMYLKDENEVMPLYSSISFDLTVTSIFTPLISGNSILIYDKDDEEFVLYKMLRENKVTVVKLTPAHLTLLKDMDNSESNIKRFIVGGEDLKTNLAKEIYNSFQKKIEIYNEYGPTETVVGCMIYKYDEEKCSRISVPIGYPADNVQIYILDKNLEPVPLGIEGEIYVSGHGVARGYLNKKELTYEKFIENPFIKGKRMYRTGDTARYLENGVIEYISRIDNQVKIRGHRIEIGEIERCLLENENVKEVVVRFKEDNLKNKILNAYVVKKNQLIELDLKKWLLKFLPKYMIPTNFIFIDKIPLTNNGKIDFKLLPNPINHQNQFIRYNTDVEKEVIKAMEEILGVENISMKDNFYQLGGDSIKAIQISSKLKNVGLNIKVKDILSYDFIGEIASTVEDTKNNNEVSQGLCDGEFSNTPIIEWFFEQKLFNESFYNQYVLLEFNKILDINNVQLAVKKLISHHDSLRINYNRKKNALYYNNDHLNDKSIIQHIYMSEYSILGKNNKINLFINEADIKFDIEKSLLFNITIFKLKDNRHTLLFTAHHLIVDGISWRIILEDFIKILGQIENNKDIEVPMKTNSFKEWSMELQKYKENNFEEEKKYWNTNVNKKFIYPVDFIKDKDIVNKSSIVNSNLDEELTKNLIKKVNDIYSIDLNELLIIALALTINKITNKEDIVIELEKHGRKDIADYLDISRTVGWFTSMYPAYFKIKKKENDYNIKQIKEQLRNIPNDGFNYGVLNFLRNELTKSDNKNIRFNYLGDFDNIIETKEVGIDNIEFGLSSDKYNSLTSLIDILAVIIDKKLCISITYSEDRFKESTIKTFSDVYLDTLRTILDECNIKEFKEFTPSDFYAVDISQDDLDSLFT